jgi:hypothetical protein
VVVGAAEHSGVTRVFEARRCSIVNADGVEGLGGEVRAQKVHRRLPHIGDLYELDKAGPIVTVVAHRSGRSDLGVQSGDAEERYVQLSLTRREALAVASPLIGNHVELVATGEV